jgi:hypothetical protein
MPLAVMLPRSVGGAQPAVMQIHAVENGTKGQSLAIDIAVELGSLHARLHGSGQRCIAGQAPAIDLAQQPRAHRGDNDARAFAPDWFS